MTLFSDLRVCISAPDIKDHILRPEWYLSPSMRGKSAGMNRTLVVVNCNPLNSTVLK